MQQKNALDPGTKFSQRGKRDTSFPGHSKNKGLDQRKKNMTVKLKSYEIVGLGSIDGYYFCKCSVHLKNTQVTKRIPYPIKNFKDQNILSKA